jgi:hypothetical protein
MDRGLKVFLLGNINQLDSNEGHDQGVQVFVQVLFPVYLLKQEPGADLATLEGAEAFVT